MTSLVIDNSQVIVEDLIRKLNDLFPEGKHVGMTSVEDALDYINEERVDVVLMETVFPEMDSMEAVRRVKKMQKRKNVICITEHSEFALEAHLLYVSGYLLKPVKIEELKQAFDNLRYPIREKKQESLVIQCFGNFEVYVNGEVLEFKRKKCKELLAYLVDRKGASCTMGEVLGILWEDKPDTKSRRSQLRTLIYELKKTLEEKGFEKVLRRSHNVISLEVDKVECDYYLFLNCEQGETIRYRGEYMKQYSWAENTAAQLEYKCNE